jgi:predicted nucleic acid-binding protein
MKNALAGITRILVDTSPFIYFLEHHPSYYELMEQFFEVRSQQHITLITTPVTLIECLVYPIRCGMTQLVEDYRNLVMAADATEFWTIGSDEAVLAARIRAQYNLYLPDSLQIAVAIQAGCEAILTNDGSFKKVQEIRPLILDEIS